ncbi:MAG: LysR family transcriptional regulator [Burkholderiales bacterium]|jgi:DNA-binding transcriptional LysR family regulator
MRHLRLLIAIDDAGRLTRAAQMLHITQPALSKALAEIERALGTPLFDRSPQGLVATRAGTTLIRAARSALGELDRASLELHRPPTEARRTMTVGSMPSGTYSLLAEAFARFRSESVASGLHDAVTFNVVDGQTPALLTQLVAGRLDLVLGSMGASALPAEIEATALYDDRMRLVVAPGHALSRTRTSDWERACEFPWVLQPAGHPTRIAFDRAVRRSGLTAPPVVYEALPSDSAVGLIRALGAVGLLPGRLAQGLAAQGLVKVLPGAASDRLAVSLPVAVFVRRSSLGDTAVKALLQCLRAVV